MISLGKYEGNVIVMEKLQQKNREWNKEREKGDTEDIWASTSTKTNVNGSEGGGQGGQTQQAKN